MNHVGNILGKCIVDLNKSSHEPLGSSSETGGQDSTPSDSKSRTFHRNFRTPVASNLQDYTRALLRNKLPS
jgi:hypothetical protein